MSDSAAPVGACSPPESPDLIWRSSQRTISLPQGVLAYRSELGIVTVQGPQVPPSADPCRPRTRRAHSAQASMSYIAYFKAGAMASNRPLTFLFNGGPGSSSLWLHMGALGPKRAPMAEESAGAAPYHCIDNSATLLECSDLVFVDAPGTGFGELTGCAAERTFCGVDGDAHAFAAFIVKFLTRHRRWNSPKYLFGESYGTARAAVLAYLLKQEQGLDLNGVILLSQSLCLYHSPDQPHLNPSIDHPYILALPSFAAIAWYHRKLPESSSALPQLLREVEQFALGDYAQALAAGRLLAPERREHLAQRLQTYTGVSAELFLQADLRLTGVEFARVLLGAELALSRLDGRIAGVAWEPMSREAEYDPLFVTMSSVYTGAFHEEIQAAFPLDHDRVYRSMTDLWQRWDYRHRAPGDSPHRWLSYMNVLPTLAFAMKMNPRMKVQVHAGYFDLATTYFAAQYELAHLPIPSRLRSNVAIHHYESGHMIYVHERSLFALRDNVARFIQETSGLETS